MEEIIQPVDRELLRKELLKRYFLRPTNRAENEIYDITGTDCPNLMREIARLREISYRAGGGATGHSLDIDDMDTMQKPYHQIIVWDPKNEQIVGGYRYLHLKDCIFTENGQPYITSAHLFHYTDYFIKDYLPHTIELGRAFVQPMYQTKEMGVKSIFALDNLWDGLGAVVAKNKDVKYLIGKVTIYPQFDAVSRNLIYAYFQRFCKDRKGLFAPYHPLDISVEGQELADEIFTEGDAKENFHILQRAVRTRGVAIPPMFQAYMNLTDKIRFFGNCVNDELSDVYETGIMVKIEDIYEEKKSRYIGAYFDYIRSVFSSRKRKKDKI
ncbi:MAG: GNAT family N-acetyltransferase [Paludibacteraceae bacterium]|nr:GNAT family N-acetyltransferase [Paludibacteraceae bacterium]MBR1786422.1 GNAT family N-acetyltransferase [Paludibacteraceae bacterium]